MRLLTILTALGLALAVGACGSEDDSEPEPGRQEGPNFQQRAGAICQDVVDREVMMEARFREKERVDGMSPALEAREWRRYEGFVKELIERLEPLEAKAPDKASFRRYLEELDELASLARSTRRSVAANDNRTTLKRYRKIQVQLEKVDAPADRMMLSPCAEVGSPVMTGKP